MEVVFTKARFSHRIFAFMVDLFLMTVTSLLLILASRQLVGLAPFYKNAVNGIREVQIASHLYEQDEKGDTVVLCEFYNPESEEDCQKYNVDLDKALKAFYSDPNFFDQSDSNSGLALYMKQRLDTGYFIYTDDSHTDVAPKDDVLASTIYKTYSKIMKEDALSYMAKNTLYIESSRTINLSFILLILVTPIVISVFIFEYIIPLCFKRGRKTIGKFLFKLGVVDVQGLSPSFWRFTARFALFLFIEVLMSVAFFIPLIISMTMFSVSKLGQSFHDYVTNTYVVNCEESRIFMNKEEYLKAKEEAENFELKADAVDLK